MLSAVVADALDDVVAGVVTSVGTTKLFGVAILLGVIEEALLSGVAILLGVIEEALGDVVGVGVVKFSLGTTK
jgi:hypothetical protein